MSHLSPLLKQATGVLAERGEGVWLIDSEGRRYLDFTAGIGVTSTGHCHPTVVAAAQEQTGRLIHAQYTTVRHRPLLALSDRLANLAPEGLDSVAFANAGTESVEAAVRLARQATGRANIIVFSGGFHGRTLASASLTTSNTKIRSGFHPMMAGVVVAPFPHLFHYSCYGWDADTTTRFCLRELDRIFATQSAPGDTAALLIEPVQGEYGYYPATSAFMQGLRERASRHGILLIHDEIQAGFGRSGRFWSGEHFGTTPDILITAKGLASGFPISAIAASEALMARGLPGSQGGTYGANAVACAAALATIQVIEEERLVDNAANTGAHLRSALEALQARHPCIADVRGLGLMQGLEIVDAAGNPDGALAERLTRAAEERGLLLLRCGEHNQVVRWLPPLIVTREQIDDALARFSAGLEEAGR